MFRLLASENLKIYHRTGTRLMFVALWSAALLAVVADRYFTPLETGYWGAVAGQSGFTLLVQVFAVIVAAGIVAHEYQWGTIKLLLIRPVSRGRILFAKYLAVVIFIALQLALLLLALVFLNGLVFALGRGGATAQAGALASFGGVGAYYLLRFGEILVYATIAFMLSAFAKSNALAIGIGFFAMVFGPELPELIGKSAWTRYFLFSQVNLVRFLQPGTPNPGQGLGYALLVCGAYTAVFYAVAWWVFMKRDVLE